jgi:hypothetical protein
MHAGKRSLRTIGEAAVVRRRGTGTGKVLFAYTLRVVFRFAEPCQSSFSPALVIAGDQQHRAMTPVGKNATTAISPSIVDSRNVS